MSGPARAQAYVSLHNIRSYRNVSMIENMYNSKKIDGYKGVLSVNTRKGKSICEFAQHGFIYVHKYLCYDICIFVSMCVYTKSFKVWTGKGGDICEFAQHGFIHESIYNMMYTFEYMYVNKQVLSVSSREGTDRCELHNWVSYTRVSIIWFMYTCEDMHVYKRLKVWGLARAQTYLSLQNIGSYTIASKI